MKKQFLLFYFSLLLPILVMAQDQTTFTVSSDAKEVVLGGYFEVSFTLANGNGTGFKAPRFDAFNLLSGPNRSSNMVIVNGQMSKKEVYSYTLQPKRIGNFPIPPASIKVKGEVLKTEIIYVKIVKGKTPNANTQGDLIDQLKEQIFIKAVPSTSEAHIGEQISLDYKLYTTRDVENYNMISESEYSGFFAQEIRYNNPVIKEVIDGVQYSTKVLKRVSLFPQQAGALTIEPMVMELGVSMETQPKKRRSFFYSPLVTRFKVETDLNKINVRPFPSDAPPTFSGAVGKFQMTSSISRNQLSTDDALSVKMNITGDGDMRQVQAPELAVSENFEVYDPKVNDEKTQESRGRVIGSKAIEYLLLPKEPGDFNIQPAFTYYDVDSSKYITLRSSPFKLKVIKGKNYGKKIDLTAIENPSLGEIRNIHTGGKLYSANRHFTGSGIFWTLFSLPFLLLGGVVVTKQVQASRGPVDLDLLRQSQARKVATQRLSGAKTFLDQEKPRAFYDEISKGLYGYIGDKINIPLSEMGKDNIRQQLESLQVSGETCDRFMGVLSTCEMALFAGKDNATAMQESYDTALEVVVKVEEEIAS